MEAICLQNVHVSLPFPLLGHLSNPFRGSGDTVSYPLKLVRAEPHCQTLYDENHEFDD